MASINQVPEFISLLKGDPINKYLLNRDINEYKELYYLLEEIFNVIKTKSAIEKNHIIQYLKAKVSDLPEDYEQKNTIFHNQSLFTLPQDFMFNTQFIEENIGVIQEHIKVKINDFEDIKISVNSIFRFIKKLRDNFEYKAMVLMLKNFQFSNFNMVMIQEVKPENEFEIVSK